MDALKFVIAIVLLAGCAGAPRAVERAQVQFLLEPSTARVYADDQFVGAARVLARRPESFRPGRRHFTITADGYFPQDIQHDLPSGLTTIRVRLRPVPP